MITIRYTQIACDAIPQAEQINRAIAAGKDMRLITDPLKRFMTGSLQISAARHQQNGNMYAPVEACIDGLWYEMAEGSDIGSYGRRG